MAKRETVKLEPKDFLAGDMIRCHLTPGDNPVAYVHEGVGLTPTTVMVVHVSKPSGWCTNVTTNRGNIRFQADLFYDTSRVIREFVRRVIGGSCT